LENWIFKLKHTIVCIDPSHGTLWRVLESCHNLKIAFTKPEVDWAQTLRDDFLAQFKAKFLSFDFIPLSEVSTVPNSVCYHGANGLNLSIDHPYNVALEPNAYSQDLRASGMIVEEISSNLYRLTYNRKSRVQTYYFPKISGFFRLDPDTIRRNLNVYGDAYFMATTFDPVSLGVVAKPKESRVVGEMMAYDILPPYIQRGKIRVSEDSEYVYDIEGVMTCTSRREYASALAATLGKKIAPLVEFGRFVASPYSTSFFEMGLKNYGQVCVVQTASMSYTAIIKTPQMVGTRLSPYNASAFVVGDFSGRKITPFESIGSAVEIMTYMYESHVRHADIRTLAGKKAMVYDSYARLVGNVHFLAHWCLPKVSTLIVTEIPVERKESATVSIPAQDLEEKTENDIPSGRTVNKSLRQMLIDYFEYDTRIKTIADLQEEFPTYPRYVISQVMMYIPTAFPAITPQSFTEDPGEPGWLISSDDFHFPSEEGSGLSSYSSSIQLKGDAVSGHLTFLDVESADVSYQDLFLRVLGCEQISHVIIQGRVERQYRLIMPVVEF